MHIRRQIELFLRDSGMAATQFGRRVANDPQLVHDIRAGREPRRIMVDKIRAFIEGQCADQRRPNGQHGAG